MYLRYYLLGTLGTLVVYLGSVPWYTEDDVITDARKHCMPTVPTFGKDLRSTTDRSAILVVVLSCSTKHTTLT